MNPDLLSFILGLGLLVLLSSSVSTHLALYIIVLWLAHFKRAIRTYDFVSPNI